MKLKLLVNLDRDMKKGQEIDVNESYSRKLIADGSAEEVLPPASAVDPNAPAGTETKPAGSVELKVPPRPASGNNK